MEAPRVCRLARWNARESYEFMYSKPWPSVLSFYSNLVHGTASLSSLFKTPLMEQEVEEEEGEERRSMESGRWARVTFKIVLAYNGPSFDGWQKQPALNTVQSAIESCLGQFVDERKAKLLRDKCSPVHASALVAGRTDKGVTALRQVCAFYTWRTDVEPRAIEDAINGAAPGKLAVKSVSKVSRAFHPNFSASWRRYLYIFPLDSDVNVDGKQSNQNGVNVESHGSDQMGSFGECDDRILDESEIGEKPWTFRVELVDRLLRQLEGKLLSYKMFARDTKASRNEGPPTECFMHHARAAEARLPHPDFEEGRRVMCVELVANRFLRRMVRVLVATAIREAAAEAEEDALAKLLGATCRRATAPPAPPHGLCLVNVGYTEFDPKICFIREEE